MSAETALQRETAFLSGVESNLEAAKGKQFRGTIWKRTADDDIDRLKALMASHRNYDREALRSMPANRRVALHGYERRMIFWKQRTGVAVASVLSPLDHYAAGESGEAPPIGSGELTDHVRKLVTDDKVHHVIGVCSPSGFTDEARNLRLEMPNVSVVLIEPDSHGGWRTKGAGDKVDSRLLQIFDPEAASQKIDRVRQVIEQRSADLLTGSLSASSIARQVELPEHLVRRAFEQLAARDAELRVSRKEGEMMIYRGAPVRPQEKQSMNVIDRIRQLLGGEADNAEKINILAERRATLAQRRDRIYEDIGQLESKESELLAQGRAATSSVPKRRLAAQLAQLRKDIGRQNATAAMLNKQIDIISTDIHNLTLIEQGKGAELPDTQQLTEHAVQAEEMLETLKADADLVSSLETGMGESLASDEELAILKEFEEPAEPVAEPPSKAQPAAREPAPERTAASRESAPPQREKPMGDENEPPDRSRDAEAT